MFGIPHFRARVVTRIKAFVSRWVLVVFSVCAGLAPIHTTEAMGVGAAGLFGMFGGAMYGFGCYPQFYMTGMGMGGYPWYSEGCARPTMCMYGFFCGGGIPQMRRQTVSRSCTLVCEREPGGGIQPPTYADPVAVVAPPPKVKKTPRPDTPPAPAKPDPTPLITDVPKFPPPPMTLPPVPDFKLPEVAPPPAEAPVAPDPTPAPPIRNEGNLNNVDPSDRCQARRDRYLKGSKNSTEAGAVCPDPTGTLCAGQDSSKVRQVVERAGVDLSLSAAAQRVMAQVYQDCRVLELDNVICGGGTNAKKVGITVRLTSDGTFSRVVGSGSGSNIEQEYLEELCNDPKVKSRPADCRMMCQNPSIFNMGGKPKLTVSSTGELVLDLDESAGGRNKIDDGTKEHLSNRGHDCAGAISAFLLADGRLMKPTKNLKAAIAKDGPIGLKADQFYHMNAVVLTDSGDKADSCFETVRLEKESPLLPGDIIAKPTHLMMIERIDSGWEGDPFGMACWGQELDAKGTCAKPLKTAEEMSQVDCSRASAEHFRFDLIHSAGVGSRGYVRTPANDFFGVTCKLKGVEVSKCPDNKKAGGSDLETGSALRDLAIRYCVDRKAGRPGPKGSAGIQEKRMSVLRHQGSKDGCRIPGGQKPKIKNDKCVGDCQLVGGGK